MTTLRFLFLGAVGGCLALAVDAALANAFLRDCLFPPASYWLAYSISGVIVAALGRPFVRFFASGQERLALIVVLVYVPSIFERMYSSVVVRFDITTAIFAGALAVASYGLWVLLLAHIGRSRGIKWGLVIGALSAAIGMAVNRNLVEYPGEPAALFWDAGIIALGLGAALMIRWSGVREAAVFSAAIAVVTVCVSNMLVVHQENAKVFSRQQPNLLLLVIDTLRADVFEDVLETTIEGRQFAKALTGSLSFDRAYAASPWTAPSMGSIMTGLYPHEHGFGGATGDPNRPLRRLTDSVPTIAEYLVEQGYATTAIGANTMLHSVSGIDRGFENYEVIKSLTEYLPLMTVLAELGAVNFEAYMDASALVSRFRRRFSNITSNDRPFFVWLHFMDPHAPLADHPELSPDPVGAGLPELDRRYRDEVRFALAAATEVVEMLQQDGAWKNTVTVVVGDHGEMLPSDNHDARYRDKLDRPRVYGHGHALFEELVRIPLLIRDPGNSSKTSRTAALFSHVDVLATIAELLNVDMGSRGRDRISAAPLVNCNDSKLAFVSREFVIMSGVRTGPVQYAMRTEDLKIIHYEDQKFNDRLFDLSIDPKEHVNRDDVYAEELERHVARLRAFIDAMILSSQDDASALDAATLRQLKALGYISGS